MVKFATVLMTHVKHLPEGYNLDRTSVDLTGLTYGYATVPGVKKNASLAIIRSNNELIIKAAYS